MLIWYVAENEMTRQLDISAQWNENIEMKIKRSEEIQYNEAYEALQWREAINWSYELNPESLWPAGFRSYQISEENREMAQKRRKRKKTKAAKRRRRRER